MNGTPGEIRGRPRRRARAWRWRLLGALLLAAGAGLLLTPGGRVGSTPTLAQPAGFELLEATIPQLQAALITGQVTSRRLVELYLARIRAYDQAGPALNAISVINPTALAEADALDSERRSQGVRGPLHGIPVIVKDNYDTKDLQTAAGSAALAGFLPQEDAFLVTKLRAAGVVIIAKSNMHEFAYGIETVGSLFDRTRNPYDPGRNPGGSSGGTGAAIAANFAAVGMGSDTCGSIRIPSSHNSLVGIRGTQGLASRTGIIPLSGTQDIGGPLGRSVTDVAITLDVIVGYDPADPETAEGARNIPRSYTDFLDLDGLRGARIGMLSQLFGAAPEDAEVAGVVRQSLEEMRRLGAAVVEVRIPGLEELLTDRLGGFLVLTQDFKFDLNHYLATHPTAPYRSLAEIIASGKVSPLPQVLPRLEGSQAVESRDTAEYLAHVVKRTALRRAILTAMADANVDALAYPTIRRKAAPLGEDQAGTNCLLSANSGLPAITVPAGFTDDGLPVGVELLGPAWGEGELIRRAYAYEQATRHRRSPASTPPLATPAR